MSAVNFNPNSTQEDHLRSAVTYFLALDIADVSAQRIGILFVSQTMPIKLKSLTDHKTSSVLHLLFLTSS